MNHRSNMNRAGAVMIVTLWIVLGIAALVLVFARSATVDLFAAANQVSALQADAEAKGALQYVLAQLDGLSGALPDPTQFPSEAVSVGAGYFWILRPPGDNETGYCFGLVDEASKLNLNSATSEMLMNLPNMTTDIAASIVSWRSPPSASTAEGADSSYYLTLPDPYDCKNSPFETVEELLLVEGVTTQLLYGDDTNRNGVLDANETDSTLGVTGSSLSTGTAVNGGWNQYVTVYSSEPAASTGGRGSGAGTGGTGAGAGGRGAGTGGTGAGAGGRGAGTGGMGTGTGGTGTGAGTGTGGGARTPPAQVGLINVNTAPEAVLLCLPGLDQADVTALVNYRSNTGADLSTIAWVSTAITRTKAAALSSYITVHSYQFSADIVAVSGDGRAYRRYLAVVDASTSPPSVLYWKDLTYLGWPLDPAILSSLRSGSGLAGTTTGITGGTP